MTAPLDLLGIGNAIVDILAAVPHDFLSRHDLREGTMRLVDQDEAERLTHALPRHDTFSGGSAANSCATASLLGTRTGFIGKVAADTLGEAFRRGMAEAGVAFNTPPLSDGAPTARSIVLVTPDGQRTMNTFLGACVAFGVHDLDIEAIRAARVLYLEGYLFDPPAAQAAFRQAAAVSREAGHTVALSLSDAFCVDRHRAAFRALLDEVGILFANEAEITSLFETNRWEDAVAETRVRVGLACLTRSEQGSLLVRGEETIPIAAEPAQVVDTTGAGDAYAAGFLHAWLRDRPLAACGRLASRAASRVIEQYGARLAGPQLRDLGED